MAAVVLAVDPGRDKCGLAVVDEAWVVHQHLIVATAALPAAAAQLVHRYAVSVLALGSQTTSTEALQKLQQLLTADGTPIAVCVIDEHHSTEEARRLYWQMNPPHGWRRLLPHGMLVPSVPVDDYAAIVIARRYFASQ